MDCVKLVIGVPITKKLKVMVFDTFMDGRQGDDGQGCLGRYEACEAGWGQRPQTATHVVSN